MLKGKVLILTKQKVNKKDGGKMVILDYMSDGTIHKTFTSDEIFLEQYNNIPLMQEIEAEFILTKFGDNTNVKMVDFALIKK